MIRSTESEILTAKAISSEVLLETMKYVFLSEYPKDWRIWDPAHCKTKSWNDS